MKLFTFKNSCLILLFSFGACSKEEIRPSQNSIKTLPAANYLISKASSFVVNNENYKGLRESKFDLNDFSPNGLTEVRLTIGNQANSSYEIISSTNPEMALIINFDSNGNVLSSLFSENIVLSANSAETKIYDLEGNLHLDFTTVEKVVTFHSVPPLSNGRTVSWWSDTGDCVSKAAQPFKNGVLNVAFDVAASVVTNGWYPATLIAACGIKAAVE